jgi:hypothetical protein
VSYPNANQVGIFNTGQRAQRRFGRNTYLYVAFRLFRDNQRLLRGSPTMIGGGTDHE